MNTTLNNVELNDLFDYNYKIYQNSDYFKFSIDSVLLAEFVCVRKNQNKLLDFCSGNAPVLMILREKYPNLNLTGIELQKEVYDLGIKSLNFNQIDDINLFNEDVKNVSVLLKNDKFDIITCNPPYFPVYSKGNINDNDIKAIARHEIAIDLDDIIYNASLMLKNGGYLYMVHRAERLADIVLFLDKYHFGLKKIQTVYDDVNAQSCFILIEAMYQGKNYVTIEAPLFLKQYETYKNIFRR